MLLGYLKSLKHFDTFLKSRSALEAVVGYTVSHLLKFSCPFFVAHYSCCRLPAVFCSTADREVAAQRLKLQHQGTTVLSD